MSRKVLMTIDFEPWFCYLPYCSFWEENDHLVEEPTMYLLDLLMRHKIKAIWYCVGWLVDKRPDLFELIKKENHVIGDHTYFHEGDQDTMFFKPFRAPRFNGEKRLYSGGFWFRAMPYWWSKRELRKSGIFYIHPHDLLWKHPKCDNPIQNFKRQIGLGTVRDKIERLMREVEFED